MPMISTGTGFGLGALKDRPGGALHAFLDFAQGHDFDFAGFGTGGRCFRRKQGGRRGRKAQKDRGNSDVHGVDYSSCLIVLCAPARRCGATILAGLLACRASPQNPRKIPCRSQIESSGSQPSRKFRF